MSNTNQAVVVYVKIGADNSIEILDNIPASATLTNSSFYDVIKNDITSDTYIAMDITETCLVQDDDSCIQYNGTNYSMGLQNSANTLNQPLDTNFLKVKASSNSSAKEEGEKVEEVGEGEVEEEEEKVEEKVGEEKVGEEKVKEEKVEEEKVEEEKVEEEKVEVEGEIKKEIPEKEEINEEWNKFANLVIGKIDLVEEDQKVPLLKELLKIKNTQIIANINDPNILKNSKKYNEELINKYDNLKDYNNIIEYLEGVHIYSLEDIDGGMSMNIFH
jgi:hypothetical protein